MSSDTSGNPIVNDETPMTSNALEEEKKERTLTKAEKKEKYGKGSFPEPLATWRDLIKVNIFPFHADIIAQLQCYFWICRYSHLQDLLAPVDKTARSAEDEKETIEIAESTLSQIFGLAENPYKAMFDIYVVFSEKEKVIANC